MGNLGKHVTIFTSAVFIVFVIVSLLLTRQIIYFDNTLQTFVFLLIVVGGYGIGSWILLEYIKSALLPNSLS